METSSSDTVKIRPQVYERQSQGKVKKPQTAMGNDVVSQTRPMNTVNCDELQVASINYIEGLAISKGIKLYKLQFTFPSSRINQDTTCLGAQLLSFSHKVFP